VYVPTAGVRLTYSTQQSIVSPPYTHGNTSRNMCLKCSVRVPKMPLWDGQSSGRQQMWHVTSSFHPQWVQLISSPLPSNQLSVMRVVCACVSKEPAEESCINSFLARCFSKAPYMDAIRAIARGPKTVLLQLRDGSYALLKKAKESDHWIAITNVRVKISDYGGQKVYQVKAAGSRAWNRLKQIPNDVWMRLEAFANGVSYHFNWIKAGVIDCVKYGWDQVKAGLKLAVEKIMDGVRMAKELFVKALEIMAKMIEVLRRYATEIMCAVSGIVAGTAMGAASYFGASALFVAGTAASGATISAAVIYGLVKVARGDPLW